MDARTGELFRVADRTVYHRGGEEGPETRRDPDRRGARAG